MIRSVALLYPEKLGMPTYILPNFATYSSNPRGKSCATRTKGMMNYGR